jgi:hypothetical protein
MKKSWMCVVQNIPIFCFLVVFPVLLCGCECREQEVESIEVPPKPHMSEQPEAAGGLEHRETMPSALDQAADELKNAIKEQRIRVGVFLDRDVPANINAWGSDARLLVSKYADISKIDAAGSESKETRSEVVTVDFQRPLRPLASTVRLSEAFLLDSDRRITQPLRRAGMEIVDPNVALGNVIADLVKEGRIKQNVDPTGLEMISLHKYVDVVIQVVVARDSVSGLMFCAKAIAIKNARVIAFASANEKEQRLPGKSRTDEPEIPDVDILLDTMIANLLGELSEYYAGGE